MLVQNQIPELNSEYIPSIGDAAHLDLFYEVATIILSLGILHYASWSSLVQTKVRKQEAACQKFDSSPFHCTQTVSFFNRRNLKGVTTKTPEQGMDQNAGRDTSVLQGP